MLTEVYIITHGEYSDYTIEAVYTDKRVAEELARVMDSEVEVWPMNADLDKLSSGYLLYNAYSSDNRDEIEIHLTMPPCDFVNQATLRIRLEGLIPEAFFATQLWARSKEEALKIAAERKTKLLYAYNEHGAVQMDF